VGRIPEVAEVDQPDEDTDNRDDLGEHISKVIQLAFKRRFFRDLGGDGLMDVANSSAGTRKDDDSLGGSIDDRGSLDTTAGWNGKRWLKYRNARRRAC
jgi:hypothetical protein